MHALSSWKVVYFREGDWLRGKLGGSNIWTDDFQLEDPPKTIVSSEKVLASL